MTEDPERGTLTAFNYDPYGNMTTSAESFNSGATTYAYDLGGRLVGITPPASLGKPGKL